MKKEICGTFHAKCGTLDLTQVFGTVPRKAERVVTLALYLFQVYTILYASITVFGVLVHLKYY
jgi:hypothetical protein